MKKTYVDPFSIPVKRSAESQAYRENCAYFFDLMQGHYGPLDNVGGHKYRSNFHKFHLVDRSPWPLLLSIELFYAVIFLTSLLHGFATSSIPFFVSIGLIVATMASWFHDVYTENILRHHTKIVKRSLRLGFILFLVSETMLFFSFFWAYFHFALSPTIQIGCVWPPFGMQLIDPWQTPLLNTILLLTSGATLTVAHLELIRRKDRQYMLRESRTRQRKTNELGYYHASDLATWSGADEDYYHTFMEHLEDDPTLGKNRNYYVKNWLVLTVILALFFTFNQVVEYIHAPFGITDGIYASLFYMLTGLHGFHVIVGTIFLGVNLAHAIFRRLHSRDHFGFTAAVWYWHFVDAVWLFLYAAVYFCEYY